MYPSRDRVIETLTVMVAVPTTAVDTTNHEAWPGPSSRVTGGPVAESKIGGEPAEG
jgi:hypothetical protein